MTDGHVARVSPLLRGQVTGHGVDVIVPPAHLTAVAAESCFVLSG